MNERKTVLGAPRQNRNVMITRVLLAGGWAAIVLGRFPCAEMTAVEKENLFARFIAWLWVLTWTTLVAVPWTWRAWPRQNGRSWIRAGQLMIMAGAAGVLGDICIATLLFRCRLGWHDPMIFALLVYVAMLVAPATCIGLVIRILAAWPGRGRG